MYKHLFEPVEDESIKSSLDLSFGDEFDDLDSVEDEPVKCSPDLSVGDEFDDLDSLDISMVEEVIADEERRLSSQEVIVIADK